MNNFYSLLSKRKSVRKFDLENKITDEELVIIKDKLNSIKPLIDNCQTSYEIVKRETTNAKFGEYAILFYSEEKDNYLLNAGYMLAEFDLFISSIALGGCYYGFGKGKDRQTNQQKFVIMYVFGRPAEEVWRKDLSEFKRLEVSELWEGIVPPGLENARLAPSACNSEPWKVKNIDSEISVYQNKKNKSVLRRILSKYFNLFDMGIYLYFLETCLNEYHYQYDRTIYKAPSKEDLVLVAKYKLK